MTLEPRVVACLAARTRTTLAAVCLCAALVLLGGCATNTLPAPDPRPSQWATPVAATGLPNLYRVNASLYRSAQPSRDGITALVEGTPLVAGDAPIRTVVSLRTLRTDASLVMTPSRLSLEHIPAQSWHPEDEDVIQFLRIATDPARQPVLVHCRRGADRTGTMVAVYRIVVEGWTKADAIDEMTRGGYDFHPMWQNLIRYIEDLDVEAVRAQVMTARHADAVSRPATATK
jgi:protein tyrosine/serine phosphatase